jgi:mannose-6-phosphate isomerase-like protein (cupin superfamily)
VALGPLCNGQPPFYALAWTGLENFAVTFERFGAGYRPPRGHRHGVQEEVYFLVSGRAEGKFNGDVIELEPWTAVRVPPQTARAFRAARDEDAVFVTIAAPQAGFDVEFIQDF